MHFETFSLITFAGKSGDDRAGIFQRGPECVVIVVADGAGGIGGGAQAAESLVDSVAMAVRDGAGEAQADWVAFLRLFDHRQSVYGGETTAVIAKVSSSGITGASVGDSGAWICTGIEFDNLTSNQARKPLLGSGQAMPRAFESVNPHGTLLVATDGLFKYASPKKILDAASYPSLTDAAQELVNSVRSRSGFLQDDVAVVLCRPFAD